GGPIFAGLVYARMGLGLLPLFLFASRLRIAVYCYPLPVTLSPQNRPSTIKYYRLFITVAIEWFMFARGEVSLHTARLPVPKIPAAKSCVSATSKLIENKRLQLYSFGHLRKTGGRVELPTSTDRTIPPRSQLLAKQIANRLFDGEDVPTLDAHSPATRAHPHSRQSADRSTAAGHFRLHQLHRPRQPLHRRAHAERRTGHFRRATRGPALRLLLDLRDPASFLRLAGRPPERQLDLRRRLLPLVRRNRRNRAGPQFRRALRPPSAPRHGRVRQLPFLQQNPGAQLQRRTSRPGEFRAGQRAASGTGFRHVVRRAADGALRLAAVFHRPRAHEPAVDSSLAQVDAEKAVCRANRFHRRAQSAGVSPVPLGLGNLHWPVLRKLRELFPDYLAALFSGARAAFFDGRDGQDRWQRLSPRRGCFVVFRLALGSLDRRRSVADIGPQNVYRRRHGHGWNFSRARAHRRALP